MDGYDLKCNATIVTVDNVVGRLTHVVIAGSERKITHLVVAQRSLRKREIVVPITAVSHTTPLEIHLHQLTVDLTEYPPYTSDLFDQATAPDAFVCDEETAVHCQDRSVGHLSRIITDKEGYHLQYIVLKRGDMTPFQTLIPADQIESISPRRIHLRATEAELQEFTDYVAASSE
jgi:hypothetical protein